jgi:hypothetical protein
MSAANLCPARRHEEEGERYVCLCREEHESGAWTFISWPAMEVLEDARARRKEWQLEREDL